MAKRKRKKLSPGASLLMFGLIFLVVGVIQLFVGTTDHTDHTERADAVVSERDVDVTVDSDGNRDEDVTVYVDYTADGQEYTHVVLNGLNADDPQEGQQLPVAYAPGEPEHVVTPESTEEGAYDMFLYIGIVLVALGLLAMPFGVLMIVAKRRRAPGGFGVHKY